MNTRHLLIAYSWSTGDLGGIGITPGLLNLVNKVAPDLPATVITMHTETSADYAFLKTYFPKFKPGCQVMPNPLRERLGSAQNNGQPGSAWHSFHQRWGQTALMQFENGSLSARTAAQIADDVLNRFSIDLFHQLERENPEAAQAFTNAGFFLYPSGTTLNFGRLCKRGFWAGGPGTDLRLSIPLFIARALNIPYGIFAESFDAIDWPVDLVYRPLFKDARFVFCRDTDSLEYLKQRDLLNASSGFRPDCTFFFNGSDEPWANAFMQTHGLKDKAFITLIGRFSETVGPISGVLSRDREQQHLGKLKSFIEAWIQKTGMPVVVCPEAKYEVALLREKVLSNLSPEAQKKCICMDAFWTPEQACSLYRRARIVVGHMHTVIFALSVGTPVLHIPYAEAGRKARMVHDAGFPDWLLDIDTTPAEDILAAALNIHHAHDQALARVQKALENIERLGAEVIAEIKGHWQ